jgi:hypothetical protein
MLVFEADISFILRFILKFLKRKLAVEYGGKVVHEGNFGRLKQVCRRM